MLLVSSPQDRGLGLSPWGGHITKPRSTVQKIPGHRSPCLGSPHSPFSAAIRWMFDFIQVNAAKSQRVFLGFNQLGHGQ